MYPQRGKPWVGAIATCEISSSDQFLREMDGNIYIGLGDNCATCGAAPSPGSSWPSCIKCHKVRYCSREPCQRTGWKQRGHKLTCGTALPKPSLVRSSSPEQIVGFLREFGPAHGVLSAQCLEQSAQMCLHSQDSRRRWMAAGGLGYMLTAMEAQLHLASVQTWGAVNARDVFNVVYVPLDESQRDAAMDAAVITAMVRAISAHANSQRVCGPCLATLTTIIGTCNDDTRQQFATDAGVWGALVKVLRGTGLTDLLEPELENVCAAIMSRLGNQVLRRIQEVALKVEMPQELTRYLLARVDRAEDHAKPARPDRLHTNPRIGTHPASGDNHRAGLFALRGMMHGNSAAKAAALAAGCLPHWAVHQGNVLTTEAPEPPSTTG